MSRRYSAIEIRAVDRSSGTEPNRLSCWERPSQPSADLPPDDFGRARRTCTGLLLYPKQAGRYLPLSPRLKRLVRHTGLAPVYLLLPRQAARYLTLCLMSFWSGTPDSHRAYACIRNRWGAISPCPWNGRAGEIRTRDFLLPKQAGWPLPYSPACFLASLMYVLKCFVFFEQTAQAIGRFWRLLLLIQ